MAPTAAPPAQGVDENTVQNTASLAGEMAPTAAPPARRVVLQRVDESTVQDTVSGTGDVAPTAGPLEYKPIPRKLFVTRVEVTRVTAIVENNDTFQAQLFVSAVFKGGATDEHLSFVPEGGSLNTPHFPLDGTGNPIWRPNAAWYLERLVFENMSLPPAEQLRQRSTEVRVDNGDLQCTIYTEGTFYEKFELNDFPFDAQDLTFALTLNVRVDGPLRCQVLISADPECTGYLSVDGFLLDDRWSKHGFAGSPILFAHIEFDRETMTENSMSDQSSARSPEKSLSPSTSSRRRAPLQGAQRRFTLPNIEELMEQRARVEIIWCRRCCAPFELIRQAAAACIKVPIAVLAGVTAKAMAVIRPTDLEFEEETSLMKKNLDIRKFPSAFFTIKVKRRYNYYMWNVMLPTFTFPLLGMLQFSLNDDYPTRLECSFGLVLTIILFKFAVVSPANFPTVNYLTLLDFHVLISQFLVFLMAFENGIAAMLSKKPLLGAATDAGAAANSSVGTGGTLPPSPPTTEFLPQPSVGSSSLGNALDYYAGWTFVGLWILQMLFFLYSYRRAMMHGTLLEDVRRMVDEGELAIDAKHDRGRQSWTTARTRRGSKSKSEARKTSKLVAAAGHARRKVPSLKRVRLRGQSNKPEASDASASSDAEVV